MKEVREFIQRRDIAYAAAFDKKDSYILKKDMQLVQAGKYNPEHFFGKFERYYNDQTTFGFEPLQLGRSGNKIVNEGLTELAAHQVGKSNKVFKVYAIGKGLQAVNIRDDALTDEIARLDIQENGGTVMHRGTTCYYSLFFPETMASVTVTETAILDSLIPVSDVMLLRTLFPTNDQINHVINNDEVFVGHVVYSGSV